MSNDKFYSFILKLSNRITDNIFRNMKYALQEKIPERKMEAIKTPVDLFHELQKLDIIGPQKLSELRNLLERIHEIDLVSTLDNFACSCGIYLGNSPSKAIAKPANQNYLEMDGYYLQIMGGQHYGKEDEGEFVELTSGSKYALVIQNSNIHRSRCRIKIDGHIVFSGSVINPNEIVTIERPSQSNGKFTFFAVDHAPPGSGINKWKNENGLVEVTFTPERADMKIICYVGNSPIALTCSSKTTDVTLHEMVEEYFDETTMFFVKFHSTPIGQRNIKLTEYGIRNGSSVSIEFCLPGGGLFALPSPEQKDDNNNQVPKWIRGATTLEGKSRQTFGSLSNFIPDLTKSVSVLCLRLVARADESPPKSGVCTPLVRGTLIPPPLPNW